MKMQQYARYRYLDGTTEIHAFESCAPLAWITDRGMAFRDSAVVYADCQDDADLRLAEIAEIADAVRQRRRQGEQDGRRGT